MRRGIRKEAVAKETCEETVLQLESDEAVLLTIYIVVCTPLVFNRKMGILVTSVIAQVLWSIFSKMLNSTIKIELDDNELIKIRDKENVIVISNHIGTIDFMIINEISKRKKMLRHSKYMLKESMKYVPILGYAQYLGFMMLKRVFEKDRCIIKNWLNYFCKNSIPFWLIIYPEGTRITPEKKIKSDIYSEKMGEKKLMNVLYPRTKGFELSCQNLKGHIKHIIDLTVLFRGDQNYVAPSLFDFIFCMPQGTLKVKIDVFELDEIDNYADFVKQRFYEKDKTLQKWKDVKNK